MNEFAKVFTYFEKCSLTWFERELVSELYPVIKQKIENFNMTRCEYGSDTGYTDTKTISKYEEKIGRIVQILDSSDQKRERFLSNFPEWKIRRQRTIEKLLKIAESLKDFRKINNRMRITANSVGLAGGLTVLASLLFPPAAPFAVAGVIAAVSGALGSAGADLKQEVLTHAVLNEATNTISNDRKLLQQLGIFEFLDELNDAVEDLFGKSASIKILNGLIEFLREVPPDLNDVRPHLPTLTSCLTKLLPAISEFLIIGPPLAAVILSISFVLFMIRRQGCVILNSNAFLGLVSAIDVTGEITSLRTVIGLKDSTLAKKIPKHRAGNFADGVGITLNVATVILNAIQRADRKLTEEVDMILFAVANYLKAHLTLYEIMYNELQILKRQRRQWMILQCLMSVTAVSILIVGLYIRIFD